MESTVEKSPEELAKEAAKVTMIWVATISIVMLFAAFCSAFFVSKGGNFWVNINMPNAFWLSTAVILTSSFTLVVAYQSIKKNKQKITTLFLVFTLILGFVFSAFQYVGWKQLMEKGNYFVGNIMDPDQPGFFLKGEYGKDFTISFGGMILNYENNKLYFPGGNEFYAVQTELSMVQYDKLQNSRNTASSYIYILTALHLVHLIGGLIYLSIVCLMAIIKKSFHAGNYLKIKLISIYWHFLGLLWVFLFLFLQFIH